MRKSLTLKQVEKITKKHGLELKSETAKKIDALMLPSVKAEFQRQAKELGMPFSEYLRRAAFAAQFDPSILHSDAVEAAEREYKAASGASRWTRENG